MPFIHTLPRTSTLLEFRTLIYRSYKSITRLCCRFSHVSSSIVPFPSFSSGLSTSSCPFCLHQRSFLWPVCLASYAHFAVHRAEYDAFLIPAFVAFGVVDRPFIVSSLHLPLSVFFLFLPHCDERSVNSTQGPLLASRPGVEDVLSSYSLLLI